MLQMCVDGSNFPKMLLEKLLSYCYFTYLRTKVWLPVPEWQWNALVFNQNLRFILSYSVKFSNKINQITIATIIYVKNKTYSLLSNH